jgi:hypothetical protein
MTRTTESSDKAAGNGTAESAIALHLFQLDMLNEVVKIALDGAHAIATRQSQAMSEFHRQFADLMSRSTGPSALEGGTASGVAFAKQALGSGISHSIALTEIAVKMEMDALAILNKSVSAGLDGTLQKISAVKG